METVNGKAFDGKLYDKFNTLGFALATEFFKQFGFDLKVNQDRYGIDCYFFDNRVGINKKVEIEVRSKQHWGKDGFKYMDLTIPCRKDKFVNEQGLYLSASELGHQLFLIDFEIIKNSEKHTKNNVYNQNAPEWFYYVPVYKCKLFEKINDKWQLETTC